MLEPAIVELRVLRIESGEMEEQTILMQLVIFELPFSRILWQQSKLTMMREYIPFSGV